MASTNNQKKFTTKIQQLIAETRAVYAAAGKELSSEKIEEMFYNLLDNIWLIYLMKELADSCEIPRESVITNKEESEFDDEEEGK